LPRIEENGGSWLRRPKLYKRVVELRKKKKRITQKKAYKRYIKNLIFKLLNSYNTF
jgi:hypothetical protein